VIKQSTASIIPDFEWDDFNQSSEFDNEFVLLFLDEPEGADAGHNSETMDYEQNLEPHSPRWNDEVYDDAMIMDGTRGRLLSEEESDLSIQEDDDSYIQHDHSDVTDDDSMVIESNTASKTTQPSQIFSRPEVDVVFGRGGHCARNIGHQNYLQERDRLCIEYRDAPDNTTKRLIQMELIQFVYDKGGRFLEIVKRRDANGGIVKRLEIVPIGPRLRKKAAQALREGRMGA
jgi:hypothetical protein